MWNCFWFLPIFYIFLVILCLWVIFFCLVGKYVLLPVRVIGSTQNDKILVKTPINLVYPPKNTTITYFLNSTLSTKRNTNLCEAYPRILVVIDTIRAHSIISYLCVYIPRKFGKIHKMLWAVYTTHAICLRTVQQSYKVLWSWKYPCLLQIYTPKCLLHGSNSRKLGREDCQTSWIET